MRSTGHEYTLLLLLLLFRTDSGIYYYRYLREVAGACLIL